MLISDDSAESLNAGELLWKASHGDDSAFSEFSLLVLPALNRRCKRMCNKLSIDSMASDFAHEVIIKALSLMEQASENGLPLPRLTIGWFCTSATNAVCDWKRREQRYKSSIHLENSFLPELSAASITRDRIEKINRREQDEYETIVGYFRWLSDKDRSLLNSVYVQGRTIIESGSELGLSPDASYKVVQRALAQIRDFLSLDALADSGGTIEQDQRVGTAKGGVTNKPK